MWMVSFNRSLFVPAPDESRRSLPARSTERQLTGFWLEGRLNPPKFSMASQLSWVKGFAPLTLSVKTECERDERSFMSVAATARRDRAFSRSVETWWGLLRGTVRQLRTRKGQVSLLLTTSVTDMRPSLSVLISCFLASN